MGNNVCQGHGRAKGRSDVRLARDEEHLNVTPMNSSYLRRRSGMRHYLDCRAASR
ncbi:unnamed protein product [Choristocarpus tenellus]